MLQFHDGAMKFFPPPGRSLLACSVEWCIVPSSRKDSHVIHGTSSATHATFFDLPRLCVACTGVNGRYQLDNMGFVWDLSDAPFRQVSMPFYIFMKNAFQA